MRTHSIRHKLFVSNLLVLSIFFVGSVLAASAFMWATIHRNIIDTQKQMVQSMNRTVETYFEEMNRFSTSLMYSEDFKRYCIEELPSLEGGSAQRSQIIRDLYYITYENLNRAYTIGVVTNDEYLVWMSDIILMEDVSGIKGLPEYYPDYQGYGAPRLYYHEENSWLKTVCEAMGQPYKEGAVISLVRSMNIYNRFTLPQALLEVQVSANDFADFIGDVCSDSNQSGLQITVFTADGQCILGDSRLWDMCGQAQDEWINFEGNMILAQKVFGENVVLLYTIPTRIYYSSLLAFLGYTGIFVLVMSLLMLFVTYRVAGRLSHPVLHISRQLENLNLSQPFTLKREPSGIYELELLSDTIVRMNDSLRSSLDDIVNLRSAEAQARFLALQSQMQPHFLYNTLAVIDGLSKHGETEQVSWMCTCLSRMLRYVSAQSEQGTALYEEVQFTRDYTEIMRRRFPEAQVVNEIPLEMMSLRVPKLILQPLVENAFKHGGRADLCVVLRGTMAEGRWQIEVRDNGDGFSQQTAQAVLHSCATMCAEKKLDTHINGMGLKNICVRLALHYHGDYLFEIRPQQGGCIVIGGLTDAGESKAGCGNRG